MKATGNIPETSKCNTCYCCINSKLYTQFRAGGTPCPWRGYPSYRDLGQCHMMVNADTVRKYLTWGRWQQTSHEHCILYCSNVTDTIKLFGREHKQQANLQADIKQYVTYH